VGRHQLDTALRQIPQMSAPLYSLWRMQTEGSTKQAGPVRAAGVGAALRGLRIQAGVTQSVLARKLGTTQSAVARMEAGRARTSLESVERAAAALGCDLGLVFERTSV
jgi:DNA-binding XRE family transcriptional regulator